MSGKVTVEFVGWKDDFRYFEEKQRVTKHIEAIAETKGFIFAQVQDMLIKHRYRAQGPWIDVRFHRERDESDGFMSYVPARLWFNEDADLRSEPEFFDEVVKAKV